MTPDAFQTHMDAQLAQIHYMMDQVTDADLAEREVTMPWGATFKLGEALVNTSLKFLTAYRMQLFLHAKTGGAAHLSTSDCWMGCSSPPG